MEKITLTNMCMIYDEKNQKVVLEKRRKSWPGYAFPGGHVEQGEAIIPSVIREVKEETGLDISNLHLVGIRDWYDEETNERTVGFLFVTKTFSGTLIDETEEGTVEWAKIDDLDNYEYAYRFKEQLPLFLENKFVEVYSTKHKGTWNYIFY